MATRTVYAEVLGIQRTQKTLARFRASVQRKIVRPAANKAAKPVIKIAKSIAPKGAGLKPDGTKRKHLKQVITKKSVVYKTSGAIAIIIGPRAKAAPHSHLVSAGTSPRTVSVSPPRIMHWVYKTGKGRGRKTVANWARVVRQPGNKGFPFMNIALKSARPQSLRILKTEIKAGIKKEKKRMRSKGRKRK